MCLHALPGMCVLYVRQRYPSLVPTDAQSPCGDCMGMPPHAAVDVTMRMTVNKFYYM